MKIKKRVIYCKKPAREDFGKLVRSRRIERGLTQVDLGELVGIPNLKVSNIETGKIKPTPFERAKLAKALNCRLPRF